MALHVYIRSSNSNEMPQFCDWFPNKMHFESQIIVIQQFFWFSFLFFENKNSKENIRNTSLFIFAIHSVDE